MIAAASPGDAVPMSPISPVSPVMSHRRLPKLHYCCFKGDLCGVLECITEGHSIHEALSMQNQHEQTVCGITPLFLAAQRGHTKVCKLLVENGANPNQPSYIEGTTDLCTPAEVAQLNLHLMLARYLRKAVRHRRQEDAVLAQDEGVAEQARNTHDAAPAAPATAFMANLSDLTNWDPATGAPARLDGRQVKKLMQQQNMDLYAWKAEGEGEGALARSSVRSNGGGTPRALAPSSSRRVNDATEYDTVEVLDNGRMLNKFLKDLDLQDWDPEQQGQLKQQGEAWGRSASRRSGFGAAGMPSGPGSAEGRGGSPLRGTGAVSPRGTASPRASSVSGAEGAVEQVGGGAGVEGERAREAGGVARQLSEGWKMVGGLWSRSARGQQAEAAEAGRGAGGSGSVGGGEGEGEDAALEVSRSRAARPDEEEEEVELERLAQARGV